MALTQWQLNTVATDTIASGDFIAFSDEGEAGDPVNKLTADNLMETGLSLVTEDVIAVATDYIVFLDGGATGNANKEQFSDVMTAVAGTGISASSGVLNVDAAQTGITSLGTQAADFKIGDGYGIVVGHTVGLDIGGTTDAKIQVLGTLTDGDSEMAIGSFTNNAFAGALRFLKSRAASIGSNASGIVAGDDLGLIRWNVDDGTDYVSESVRIVAEADGTFGTDNTPGRLLFMTTPAAGASPIVALTLDSSQNATFAGSISIPTTDKLYFDGGGDTYMVESSANVLDWYISGVNDMRLTYIEAGSELHVEGDIVAFSTTIASDARLKENITTLDSPLEQINKLRGVSFDWSKTGEHSMGVIAQEVEALYPYLVKENDLNGMKAVNYNALIGLLIEGIKELQK